MPISDREIWQVLKKVLTALFQSGKRSPTGFVRGYSVSASGCFGKNKKSLNIFASYLRTGSTGERMIRHQWRCHCGMSFLSQLQTQSEEGRLKRCTINNFLIFLPSLQYTIILSTHSHSYTKLIQEVEKFVHLY